MSLLQFWPFFFGTGLGEHVKANDSALLTEGDQKIAEKVRLLKDKISSNISAMPIVLKRMKECMSKIENLDSYDGIIHPVFKKQNTSWPSSVHVFLWSTDVDFCTMDPNIHQLS